MAVVNKFNVNKQEARLDADIIENMSANDVSYNSSLQYDENTVGEKLSELKDNIISSNSVAEVLKSDLNAIKNSIQDISGDTLYISDSRGNVIASFNNEGLYVTNLAYKNDSGEPTNIKLIIESIIDRLGADISVIEDMYPDALYVTDVDGNVIASFNNEGLKAINIPNNINNYLWNNEEFFVIGDSLSTDFGTGDGPKVGWIYPFKTLMGAKFDGKRNSQHISVGGTTTVQGNSFAGQIRARLLVKELNEEGIYPKHIIYENVNDISQARLTASNSSVDNEPFMMSGNFIQDISIPQQNDENAARAYFDENINTILNGKTPHHGDVFMMPYKSTGVTVTINGTPTSDGVLSVIVNGTTRTLRVSTGEDIQSIIDKIIENDFLFFTDMQIGNNAISFVCISVTIQSTLEGKTAEQIAKFTFTGTGLSFTSVKDDSASASLPLSFYSHDMSDWTNPDKWMKLIDIPYCAVLKGVVEYLTTSFPECELIMMIAPSFALSYDDSGMPYKYTDGSANQNEFTKTKEVRSGKYIEDWKAVANMYGIKYVDVCSEWGVTCSNYATFYDSGDIHPKDKGYIAIGNVMYKNLK